MEWVHISKSSWNSWAKEEEGHPDCYQHRFWNKTWCYQEDTGLLWRSRPIPHSEMQSLKTGTLLTFYIMLQLLSNTATFSNSKSQEFSDFTLRCRSHWFSAFFGGTFLSSNSSTKGQNSSDTFGMKNFIVPSPHTISVLSMITLVAILISFLSRINGEGRISITPIFF